MIAIPTVTSDSSRVSYRFVRLTMLIVKVYGAPAVIESLVMYYNKDLVKRSSKTFADLETLLKIANMPSLEKMENFCFPS